jgi:hypothetical protein
MVRRESEHLIRPAKRGNACRADPVEERGCLVMDPLGGHRPRASNLDCLST